MMTAAVAFNNFFHSCIDGEDETNSDDSCCNGD